jgi:transposase
MPALSAIRKLYVGIDVCKEWLDVYIHPTGKTCRVPNTSSGFVGLCKILCGYEVVRIVMEATGKHHREVHRVLCKKGYAVSVINPARPWFFARALGKLAKTDQLDARLLALMAESVDLKVSVPPCELMEELKELMAARQSAVDQQTALKNQLGETTGKFLVRELTKAREQTKKRIARIEKEITRLIKSDPVLERRYDIVCSIPGLGAITAAWLVIGLSELGSISNKQAAFLVGLAPIDDQSAERSGPKHIKGGRADVRRGIYMAALSAARSNPDLKRFHSRLIASGKAAKVALIAVLRKLVVLANTLLTQDRPWQPLAPKAA